MIETHLRDLAPVVLAAVIRRFGDFSAAEDAVQEALLAAAMQWPREGVPENPRGWLIRVAARRRTDQLRAELARRRREAIAMTPPDEQVVFQEWNAEHDDTLLLLFMCCHPALTRASAIALTLRAVGGLTTAEIASAFLVPEATMAQRISRAKQRIKASGVPFAMPDGRERVERLGAVLHVLYLIFNEGYTSSSGDSLHRADLSHEAIRLTRAVHEILPDDAEVTGLLALMLLTDARRPARTGPDGELIPLDEQDRRLWNRDAIAEGIALLTAVLPRGAVGPYQVQAAIAAVHDEAPTVGETDWLQIHGLYGLLERMSGNPMVTLNHAIARAMVAGPAAGLAMLDALEPRLAGHHRLHAVRAHLLEMRGDRDGALAEYRAAARKTASVPEQRYLLTRAARLVSPADGPASGRSSS
jgi:RNA polymerase sigma factor (sigma-70 family)